jgi:hypothetical protein
MKVSYWVGTKNEENAYQVRGRLGGIQRDGCGIPRLAYRVICYLGLPLGLHKPTPTQLQPEVDNKASRLQPWCTKIPNHGCRKIIVQITLCAISLHAMMSLDIPPKIIEEFQKNCCAFLWKGRCDVNGGHCLVVWDKVTSPKCYGGIGLPNLRLLNLALWCLCAWLQWEDSGKAWAKFDLHRDYRLLCSRGALVWS